MKFFARQPIAPSIGELTSEPEWDAAVSQASACIALLRAPTRTLADERAVQRWLEESPLHRIAFEIATDVANARPAPARTPKARSLKVPLKIAGILAVILTVIAWTLYG